MTNASYDRQDWAKLVQEIKQAKSAFDDTTSSGPSSGMPGGASAPPRAAAVDSNLEFKPVLPPAAPQVSAASHSPSASIAAALAPSATTNPRFDDHELTDNIEELPDVDLLASQNTSPARSSGIRGHLGWGIGGFVIGAICWHLVGFWVFVGDLVFTGNKNTTVVQRNVEPSSKPRVLSYVKKRTTGAAMISSKNCSAFYRDDETGLALSTKCQSIVRSPGSIGKLAE